ncbi:MAG: phage holin family protein [Chloroflexi bacterium]|nr:MAG: phage holin family protein [Chloroflexota bacterium]
MSRIVWVRYLDETEPPWDQGDVPWIVRILVRWAITIVAFLAAEWFVNALYDPDRFHLDGTTAVLLAPAIFVVVRAITRPILLFLTCPLQIITLGLFLFVVNALILLLTEEVCDWFDVRFDVEGFWAAFIGALVISLVSFALSRVLRRRPFRQARWL